MQDGQINALKDVVKKNLNLENQSLDRINLFTFNTPEMVHWIH